MCVIKQDGWIRLCKNVVKSYWQSSGVIETEGSVWVQEKHGCLHWQHTSNTWICAQQSEDPILYQSDQGAHCRLFFVVGHRAGSASDSKHEKHHFYYNTGILLHNGAVKVTQVVQSFTCSSLCRENTAAEKCRNHVVLSFLGIQQ